LLLNKKCCTTAQVKQNIADTASSKAERGLVKAALCTTLAALPYCIYSVDSMFIGFIVYDNGLGPLTQNAAELLGMAHPFILFFVVAKVREHFANDWFFWK
jgi:hypothetical protein